MRHLAMSAVLLLLVAVFTLVPVSAAPSSASATGVILQAHLAQLSSANAVSGATVFDGDKLLTDNGGSLQVRFGNAQAYLLEKTSAIVNEGPAGLGATLTGGTVILSSGNGGAFQLVADGATIRPASAQPTTAQITLVDARNVNLIATKGPLQISMDDEVQTVPEGSSVRMVVQPQEAAASSPDPQGGAPTGRNRFLIFALALVGVGVAIGLWQALVSPSAPK